MPKLFALNMKPGEKYVHMIPKSLHISRVAIENDGFSKIYVTYKAKKFIMATVFPTVPQASLDLIFGKKELIAFSVEGNATVSLSGCWGDDKMDNIENSLTNIAKQVDLAKAKIAKLSSKVNAEKDEEEPDGNSDLEVSAPSPVA